MELEKEKRDRLKKARRNAHFTQKQLGEKSGYTPQFISALENGRKKLTYEAAHHFAKALNVNDKWLMGENTYKNDEEKSCAIIDAIAQSQNSFIEQLREMGFIVEYWEDKFIIIPPTEYIDFHQKLLPLFNFEDKRPMICTTRELNRLEYQLINLTNTLYAAFLNTCERVDEKYSQIAHIINDQRREMASELKEGEFDILSILTQNKEETTE